MARLGRVAALLLPAENPSRVAYGTILVGALLAAESGHHEGYGSAIASTLTAAVVFWLVHSYTDALERRVQLQQRLTASVLVHALGREWPIMRGAAIPVVALLLAWVLGASLETAMTAALWSAIAAIFVFELAAGLGAGARGRELALDACVGAALGAAMLALKALVG